ncbi:hypothetical protein [Vogesella indigofera]|uniref:hypothetical protein n=1 Tax=Vogesella indigofera TaxID=45465 RepID=UPI00234E8E0A|nr:hypothetical protein [Vogesella indigofera]MDC7697097.1 hypothetical protein [Vogesella indigofera]
MRTFTVAGKPQRQARLAASRKPQAASRNVSSNSSRGGVRVSGRLRRYDYKEECFVLSSAGSGSGLIWIKGWRDKAVR